MSEKTKSNEQLRGKERELNDLKAIEHVLSIANTRFDTKLDRNEMKRTVANSSSDGTQIRLLNPEAAKHREDAEQVTDKEIQNYQKLQVQTIEGMNQRVESLEALQKLLLQEYDKMPEAITKKFPINTQEPKEIPILKTLITSAKNSLDEVRGVHEQIQSMIVDGEDQRKVATAMNTIWVDMWTAEELAAMNAVINTRTSRALKLRVAKTYAAKVAQKLDDVSKQIDELHLEEIANTLAIEALKSDQDQRDLLLDQQPNRAQFLTRISGTPKATQLLDEATVTVPDVAHSGKAKKQIDVRYLAYCIRYAADLKSGKIQKTAAEQLNEVQNAIGANGKDFIDLPATDAEKDVLTEKIDTYLKTVIKLENPAGVDTTNLLMRMQIKKEVIDALQTDPELLHNVSLRTLLLFKGLQPNANQPHFLEALFSIIQEKGITKTDLIQILTFLHYKIGEKEKWVDAQKKAEAVYQKILDTKSIKEEGPDGIISYTGKNRAENRKKGLALDTVINDLYINGTLPGKNRDILRQIIKEEKIDLPWEKDVEFMVAPIADVAKNGFNYWLKYVKDVPKDFSVAGEENKKWKKAVEASRMLDGAAATINQLIELQPKDADGKLINSAAEDIIKKAGEDMEKNRGELAKPNDPSSRILAQHADAVDAVKVSRYIHDILNERGSLKTRPMEQQDAAFWLAMHIDITTALDYLNGNPPDFTKLNVSEQQLLDLRKFMITMNVNEQTRGIDILLLMKNRLGLQVSTMAYDVLQQTRDANGVPLSAGPARLEEWLRAPQNAGPALEAILVGDEQVKAAFIRAFTTNTQQQYPLANGLLASLNPAEVRGMVESIQFHLQRQKMDAIHSATHSQKKERFNDPLDVMRSGKDALFGMLHSGDRVQQGLAITMMVATGFILYRTWTKGGTLGKGFALSVPLFFGSDAVLRKMTGQGVMDRLGLQYMNEEDRGTAIEQFMRQYEKHEKYAFLKTDAGQTAMRALTDGSNLRNKIPVKDLVQWRLDMNANAGTGFHGTLPNSLKNAAAQVKSKLPDMQKKALTTKQRDEKSAEYLYLAFEALCLDVAERNKLPEPKAVNGAHLIQERYVDCTDKMAYGENTALIKKIEQDRGGFTMLDVLVFERPTPAANELLLQNDTLLEWALRGTGIAVAVAKKRLQEGAALGQVYLEHGIQVAPEYYEAAIQTLTPKALAIYETLRLICLKNYAAVKAEAYAALNLMSKTLSEIGVIITEYGPDAIQWTWETGTYAGRKTIDALQNAYRMMHANGLVTGPLIDFFDRIALSIGGFRLTDLVLFESAMESDDPAVQNKHVEALSEDARWTRDFLRQLNTATTGVTESQIQQWVKKARDVTGENGSDPYHKMVSYELVKRKVYSYILQNRVNDEPLDLSSATYEMIEKGNDQLDAIYGIVSLQVLKTEKNEFKVKDWGLPSIAGVPIDVILNKIPNATIKREDARQYLTALDEFYTHFHRRALAAFPERDPEREQKLKQYEAFLQTVLTNAVLDMTLSAAAGKEELNAHILPRDKTLPTPEKTEPFHLKIEQAQTFLDFLRAERGNSPNIEKLKNMDFKAFEQSGDMGDLALFIPKAKDTIAAAPNVAEPLSAEEVRQIDTALDADSKNIAVLKKMLEGNTPQYHRQTEIVDAFNKEAAKLAAAPKKENLPEVLVVLQGASQKKELRDAILKSFADDRISIIRTTAAERAASKHPDILNDIIDRAALLDMEKILQELQDISIDAVALHPRNETFWQIRLAELLNLAQTPKIRDFASQLLEYVKYQIRNNKIPDEHGNTNYAKYLAYLKTRGVSEPPPEDAWYKPSAHAKYRMSISSNVSDSVLDSSWGTWTPILGDYMRASSPQDKLYLLKQTYGLE